jgi:acyl-CoA dehydrogenase
MATVIDKKLRSLRDKAGHFAVQEIASRPDLAKKEQFPLDIWRKMGRENLLGLSLPADYGGLEKNYLAMAVVGEALVDRGGNLGLALSWLIHLVVARFMILGFGTREQGDEFLPKLAAGQMTSSLAVSEPDTGAHPRHLKTSALSRGDHYILSGEKSYLTNGPLADLFIVFAVTGEVAGKKHITAFLVSRDTPGLSVTEQMTLAFLRPSPHCGIRLENCSVPASRILGKKGFAYDDMIKPFREVEDALMMGPLVGGMSRQFEMALALIRENKVILGNGLKQTLGQFQSLIDTLRVMAYEAAAILDSGKRHREFLSLILAARHLRGHAQHILERFITESGLKVNADFEDITRDIDSTGKIAQNVSRMKLKKLGESLLQSGEFHETAA